MLIEFRVTNFRSIRGEQTLSMVAAKDSSHATTNITPTGLPAIPNVTRSAVVYGANAAGKSNLMAALAFMREVVAISATQLVEGQRFNCQPFKLNKQSAKAPSEFELTFLIDGIRYQYGFKLNCERVVEEWLLVYKTAKAQQWFRRTIKGSKDAYEFSVHFTGKRKLWEESTRANALFLSTATQLNSELLRPVFLWITQGMNVIRAGMQPLFDFTIAMAKDAAGKGELLRFLEAADLSIIDFSLELKKMQEVGVSFGPGKLPAQTIQEVEKPFVRFVHRSDKELASFEMHEESLGTQRLFAFAGPILDVLHNGRALAVDELDGSLHPLMVRYLVKLFHSELNKHGAQLIFTTHDTSLLDQSLFRRDQIWFVEKDRSQATRLYPMTDFSPRKNEALERGYLAGRYGALPFLSDLRT
jgi:hypothetical protein